MSPTATRPLSAAGPPDTSRLTTIPTCCAEGFPESRTMGLITSPTPTRLAAKGARASRSGSASRSRARS
eukprot:CAMPEP_0206265688 /NCGR_PEP_ID=MMETSP0047_2-20121206/30148_1 /ASSEMBLY_ACC=CAM_ASM_000192 /TAXON_ID=195065 /ORGANISM="Chroomonas mesostigmatica_cf, Strain CCMP1168" /LENGTH=68 /DNA_ID=CAMNT_0053693639 /DNA_START=79 /DNA_END=282 /DNA_ORIENTATION=+